MNQKTILILFLILTPFLLILFSHKIILFSTELNQPQKLTLDYLNGKYNLKEFNNKINQDSKIINITNSELSHLKDVQQVMNGTNYLFYVLLFICTLIFTYYKKKEKIKLLKYGGIITLSLIGLFLISILINFNLMFDLFHQIFFPQGNWLFSQTSFLITTFPITFFISITWKIIFLTLFLAIIFILVSYYLQKRSGHYES